MPALPLKTGVHAMQDCIDHAISQAQKPRERGQRMLTVIAVTIGYTSLRRGKRLPLPARIIKDYGNKPQACAGERPFLMPAIV